MMAVRSTKDWERAAWMHENLCVVGMMPFLGEPLSSAERIERLKEIVGVCDQFYPALIELGLYGLGASPGGDAERLVDDGFSLMLELAEPDHLTEEVEVLVDNLERLWRFDLIRRYMGTMIERDPVCAAYRDSLAHALERLGNVEAALAEAAEAVALEPNNSHYRCNQGWIQLAAGDFKKSRKTLQLAAALDPGNEVTQGNLVVLDWLDENGGSYRDYLLRPLDSAMVVGLTEDDEWEELDSVFASLNRDRLEAMALELLESSDVQRRNLSDLLPTLSSFFDFFRSCRSEPIHLIDDADLLIEFFRPLMHKFIFKHSDADRGLIEEICDAVLVFFAFLSSHDLVDDDDFRRLEVEVLRLKPAMIDKAERYKVIRKCHDIGAKEKERILGELFEGDHEWPFL
jgi:tetratricopeptide (TPR) repeat protein